MEDSSFFMETHIIRISMGEMLFMYIWVGRILYGLLSDSLDSVLSYGSGLLGTAVTLAVLPLHSIYKGWVIRKNLLK